MFENLQHVINSMKHGWSTRPAALSPRNRDQKILQTGFRRGVAHAAHTMYSPAAETGRQRGDWMPTIKSSISMVSADFNRVCARSELAARTNAIARRALQILKTYAVGSGLKPFPAVRDSSGKLADEVNKKLRADWQRFNDQGLRTGNTAITMTEGQGLEFDTMSTYGSCLSNIIKARPGSHLPFAFQLVKPTLLDFSRDNYKGEGTEAVPKSPIIHGIERNDALEPINFFIRGEPKARPASIMDLHFHQKEVDLYLGLPWLLPVLPQIWDLQQIFDDKMTQSRAIASIAMWTEQYDHDIFSQSADQESENKDIINFDSGSVLSTKTKPETIPLDDTLDRSLMPLVKYVMLQVAIGLGYSYQAVSSDLDGANFSSARMNKIGDNKFSRSLFKMFYKTSCQYYWQKFVEWEIAYGKIPGVTMSEYKADPWMFHQAFWLPEGEDYVSPLEDIKAMEAAYRLGSVTLQDICAFKGKDWQAVLQQRANEKLFIDELGLTQDLVPHLVEDLQAAQNAQDAATNQNANIKQEDL